MNPNVTSPSSIALIFLLFYHHYHTTLTYSFSLDSWVHPPEVSYEFPKQDNCGKFASELMAFFLRFANCYTFMLKSASLCLIFVFVWGGGFCFALLCFLFFETGSHYVGWASLKFVILLPQSPKHCVAVCATTPDSALFSLSPDCKH
jgi:hypothetical protein